MFHALVRLSVTIGDTAVLLFPEKCCGDPQPWPRFGPSGKKLLSAPLERWVFTLAAVYCSAGVVSLCPTGFIHNLRYCPRQAPISEQAILTVLQFCKVLQVTVHQAKFLCSDCSSVSQFLSIVIELMYIAAIILMRFRCHDTRQQRFAHTRSIALSIVFFSYSMNFAYHRWWMLQWGYRSVHF